MKTPIRKLQISLAIGVTAVIGGSVGAVLSMGGSPASPVPAVIVQRSDATVPTTTVVPATPTTVASAPESPPTGSGTVNTSSGAASAPAAVQPAPVAPAAVQPAPAAAAAPPVTTTTTPTGTYCAGSLAADDATPQYPAGVVVANYGYSCTDPVGTFVDVFQSPPGQGLAPILDAGGWFRVS